MGGVSSLVRQPGKLVGGEGLLDQWEEHLFLVADVLLEPLTELVQLFGIGIRRGRHVLAAPTEVDMFDQNPDHGGMVMFAVSRVSGEKQLLLDTEMVAALPLPEVHERGTRLRGGIGVRPLQPQRGEQPVVVLT